MKIVKFLAAQVKGIKVVEFEPKQDIVKISGTNEAGKSTVLDIIRYVFGGDIVPDYKKSGKVTRSGG